MSASYSAVFSGTSFAGVSVSAAQDLFSMLASSSVPFIVTQVKLAASGITSPSEIVIARKRLTSVVTQGSGGTVIAAANLAPVGQLDPNTPRNSTTTVHTNDTTRATTTGNTQIIDATTLQLANGDNDIIIPELWIDIPVSCAFILGLEVAPGSAVTLYGTVYYIEKF